MLTLASGEARRLIRVRAGSTYRFLRRVRGAAPGLFFCLRARALPFGLAVAIGVVLAGTGCTVRPDPHVIADAYDRADRTGLYRWIVDHEPSAIVVSQRTLDRIRTIVPTSRVYGVELESACSRAAAYHAALVVVLEPGDVGRRERDVALDCGIALFRDSGGLIIAPR